MIKAGSGDTLPAAPLFYMRLQSPPVLCHNNLPQTLYPRWVECVG